MWLDLFEGEDVCVGPVATLAEAAVDLAATAGEAVAPAPGEHTEAWRAELESGVLELPGLDSNQQPSG